MYEESQKVINEALSAINLYARQSAGVGEFPDKAEEIIKILKSRAASFNQSQKYNDAKLLNGFADALESALFPKRNND